MSFLSLSSPYFQVLVSMIYGRNEQRSIPSSPTSVNSTIIDIQSPPLNMELGSKIRPGMKKRTHTTLPIEELESFPNFDEEVLGIITLEDVYGGTAAGGNIRLN
ncbi:hypothetical protein CRYUN_Cryun13aG0081400 [Craigia yunnanensis]